MGTGPCVLSVSNSLRIVRMKKHSHIRDQNHVGRIQFQEGGRKRAEHTMRGEIRAAAEVTYRRVSG